MASKRAVLAPIIVSLALFLSLPGTASGARHQVAAAADQLASASSGGAQLKLSPATGTARRILLERGSLALETNDPKLAVLEFLGTYKGLFGIENPTSELELSDARGDHQGFQHLSYSQRWRGLPVFGAMLRFHFAPDGSLAAVNGLTVPVDEGLDPDPRLGSEAAEHAAVIHVRKWLADRPHKLLAATASRLVVFRTGLVRGAPGRNHLAWEVEVGDGAAVREFVYLDAHNGKLLDRISGIHEIRRSIHSKSYGNVVWSEGDTLPFSGSDTTMSNADVEEVNTLIDTAKDVYDVFRNISGGTYLSFSGYDSTMHSVQGSTALDCPNAQWNGRNTEFCSSMATDDIIAHEWAHAYTGATHSLIYQWQSGALNEAYSDIFGEAVDLLNGRGTDSPGLPRMDGACSTVGGTSPPSLVINGPTEVSGSYAVGDAAFNPNPPWSASGVVELVDDQNGVGSDACSPIQGFTPGRVALIDRGTCTFRSKVSMALAAGAVAAIIINNQGDEVIPMGGDPPNLSIPSLFIGQSAGEALKDALAAGVSAEMSASRPTDPSLRWLIGEDSWGAIRDMWLPSCFGDPAATTDGNYYCGEDDGGGVHTNSGVPNHAFALIVDGGSFGGRQITGLGLVKAMHIYWRAMAHYQVPTTDFEDHAELIHLSCTDLVGATLFDPLTGDASSERINAFDCYEVVEAMDAVGMSEPPVQCDFQPLLLPDPPATDELITVFSESFDSAPGPEWLLSNEGTYAEYDPRDWQWTTQVPEGGDGGALFAVDSLTIGNCMPGSDDQSGVMYLESPEITIPRGAGDSLLVFDHYVATEANYDGGNLKISVNGGPYELIRNNAFVHNPYNDRLFTGAEGNTNPMRGENAFTGTNGGSFEGSWGQSQISLSSFATAGDHLRIRFDFGVDGCNGNLGWYVDNVAVLVSAAAKPRRSGGPIG